MIDILYDIDLMYSFTYHQTNGVGLFYVKYARLVPSNGSGLNPRV